MPIANNAGDSSTLGDEQNVFNGDETDFQKTTIPCPMFVPTVRPSCRYVGIKVNQTTDLTEPKETH
jgi:hypothetical protein